MINEFMKFYENLSFSERALLKEIINDDTIEVSAKDVENAKGLGNEGMAIIRQNWTTQGLREKKENRICMMLASRSHDPLHEKYVKFFKLSRFWRAQIRKKYIGRARSILAQAGGSNGIASVSVADLVKKNVGGGPSPAQGAPSPFTSGIGPR